MAMKKKYQFFLSIALVALLLNLLNACSNKSPANPPYNNFEQTSNVPMSALTGAATGATVGAIVSAGSIGAGAVTGGLVAGTMQAVNAARQETPAALIQFLTKEDVQVIQDGDMITLLVPTDVYYLPDTYEFDDVYYLGLIHIAQLVLKTSTNQVVYVAGFSDGNIGSPLDEQKLSQQRAQQMADFLWANGVPLRRLSARGYGEKFDIADNFLIHGAAMNRRVEIQWRWCK